MPRSADEIRLELLVLRCRRREAAAWDELVRLFHDRLFYFVRRLVSSDEQAAVVMQELWMQVLRSLPGLQSTERLAPWLYTIARRMVINRYRQREPRHVGIEPESEEARDHEPFEQFENVELVHFGLNQLPFELREVLTLHFLEEFPVAEISRILEIPEGTVKSRLSRARSELRDLLRSQRDSGPHGAVP